MNLKNRVRSYFRPPASLGPKTAALVSRIAQINHIEVRSEVEALLLESRLIRKFRPPYNLAGTDDKSPYYIHITPGPWPKPVVTHHQPGALAGPFLSGRTARRILKEFRTVAPYCLAPRPVRRPCLYSHLGLCRPCPATGDTAGYNRNIYRLKRLLKGQFSIVSSELKKNMTAASKSLNFEKAADVKRSLDALRSLLAAPVMPDEYLVNPNLASDLQQASLSSLGDALLPFIPSLSPGRIEFYDNSHLSGRSPTSAMTVANQGRVTPGSYRHFTLSPKSAASDVDMMAEVLSRRLKRTDWPNPDLIVLDGGLPQLSVLKSLPSSQIPFIALAKRFETIYFPDGRRLQLPSGHPGLRLLLHLRDEAHRFSRRLHHKHRAKLIM